MVKKIKVCFVQAFAYAVFNPASGAKIGGAEVDLYNIGNELIKDDKFDVYFLVADFGQKPLEVYNNIKVVKGHSQKKTIKNYVVSFYKIYRKLAQINADIYVTANLSKYVGFTNLYCKIFKKIHIHRTEHQNQVNKSYILKKIKRGSSKYLLFYLGFVKADYIVVQNDEDRTTLKKTYTFPSTVIRNSYPIQKISNGKREFILWVARGERWKRPETFIKLANEFPNEKFIMIMPVASDKMFFNSIKKDSEKIKNLHFIPGVNFSEVDKYYKNAKIFVNTSQMEGFPNSFNQAMNSSTPILSLNINPDNFINENQVGIFCNDNFEKLKEGLEQLLDDRDLWRKFSENCFDYVKSQMNIEKEIKKWKIIFICFYKKKKFQRNKI